MRHKGRFRSPAESIEQDWARLASYLAGHGLTLDETTPARQFAGGVANLNYLIHLDGRPAVLRRPPAGQLAAGANDMVREHRVMSGLSRKLALVPTPLLLCEDAGVLGAPFQIIEQRDGIAIGGRLPEHLQEDPGATERLSTTVVNAMADLHRLEPASVGLEDLGRPEGFLDRQAGGWAKRAQACYPDGLPRAAEAIVSYLAKHPFGENSGISVLHCDFKPDNMLVDEHTLAPCAIIDWDMGTRGDPLFDLAVLLSYWIEPSDPHELRALEQVPSLEPGAPTRSELAASYFNASGREAADLTRHLVLARFRLAIAWMQLFRQYQRGQLIDPRYANFEKIADAVLAWTADSLTDPS